MLERKIEFKIYKMKTIKTILALLALHLTCTTSMLAQSFSKVSNGPIVTSAGDSRSVNWVDVNNDELPDLMITNGPSGGQNNFLYLNTGGGNFTAVSTDTIVKDNQPSDGATWADCDNDGDLDCFVANWYNSIGLFYNNNGNGTFTYNSAAGLTNGITYSETASWGDYDADGYVDLYIARSGGTIPSNRNFLFHNNQNNTFTKITAGSPVTDAAVSRSVNWTDVDLDGDLDLFVTNEDVSNNNEFMYRNEGAGNFTKLTAGALLNDGRKTMSSSWADFDNDGDLDVFLTNDNSTNALFRNDGNFVFTKLSSDTVSTTPSNSFSSAWSDVDNDGDLDLFVTNSFKTNTKLPCYFYINNGNSSFTRIGSSVLTADSAWTYGCAFGDYDNDGFEDLAVATCRFQGIDAVDFLYHNDGNSNHWLTLKLIGTTTNRSALGTKIRVKAIINGNAVWQLRELTAQSSYCGENDLRAHFGLGNAALIDSIKVEWLSGLVEYFASVPVNQFLTLTEGQGISSIFHIKNNVSFDIFPNPAKESITLEAPNFKIGDQLIFSTAAGKIISALRLETDSNRIQLSLAKQGISKSGNYFITLKTKEGNCIKKLIKL